MLPIKHFVSTEEKRKIMLLSPVFFFFRSQFEFAGSIFNGGYFQVRISPTVTSEATAMGAPHSGHSVFELDIAEGKKCPYHNL